MSSVKYYTTSDKVKENIEKYGVAIVPGLLDKEECDKGISGMWDTFEYLTQNAPKPVNRNDNTSWKTTFDLSPSLGMIYGYYGLGHSQFIWDIRQNPKCINVFANMWGTSDLISSFDGFSYHSSSSITGVDYAPVEWYHTDQSYTKDYFEGVQSWVTLYDVNEGDATLVFLEYSHLYQQEIRDEFNKNSLSDWNLLTEEEIEMYENYGCSEVNITCPAGSLVMWDSRLVHYGRLPDNDRVVDNTRAVIYLNYTPKENVSDEILDYRHLLFEKKITTNHQSYNPIGRPRVPNDLLIDYDIPELGLPVLSDVGKKLIG